MKIYGLIYVQNPSLVMYVQFFMLVLCYLCMNGFVVCYTPCLSHCYSKCRFKNVKYELGYSQESEMRC